MKRDHRMAVYEAPLHEGRALVRPAAGIALKRLLLVGGRAAQMLAPPLLAIAVEHGAVLTVYTRPDWASALPKLLHEHTPDVVLVEGFQRLPIAVKHVWLPPRGASSPLDFAAWAAQAWRAAARALEKKKPTVAAR